MNNYDVVRSTFSVRSSALAAFDHMTAVARAAGFILVPRVAGAVRSIELQFSGRRLNPYSIQAHSQHINFYLRRPILSRHAGLFEAAVAQFGPVKPNRLGEYRKHLQSVEDVETILSFLRDHDAWPDPGTIVGTHGPTTQTGWAPYAATDRNLREYALEPTMRWLVASALDGTTMTHGQVKQRLEQEAGFSTVFATRIGLVAGELMERLQAVDPNAPLINVIVVNQQDGLPSKGAGSFMAARFQNPKLGSAGYKERHPARWKEYFERAAAEVYAYSPSEWSALYALAFGGILSNEQIADERAKRHDGNEEDYGAGNGKYGAGGEGVHHKALRLWVTANPHKVRRNFSAARSETEFCLDSGDRIDAVYHLPDRTIVLEVKSRISNEVDLRRGVYQCIKYRAVKEAMDVRDDVPVDAFLVTETAIPGEIAELLKRHRISHYQAPMERE